MIREEAMSYFEGQKKKLEDFRKIYQSPHTVGYQATTKEISFYDMAVSALSESDNVGMSMSHRAIAKVIGDYIANHQGDSDKQYTAHEIKTLLVSDDSDNHGEWIYDKGIENWRCSKCGQAPPPTGYVGNADFMATHFKFCNHCGADMRGHANE